jgi:hypothetical protein
MTFRTGPDRSSIPQAVSGRTSLSNNEDKVAGSLPLYGWLGSAWQINAIALSIAFRYAVRVSGELDRNSDSNKCSSEIGL